MRLGKSVRRVGGAAAVAGLAALGLVALAQAQAPAPLKIGITEGFSGVYADLNLGEVEAAQMAIDDFGGKVLGRPIELLSADHQTKPDIGAQIARKWYDVDGVSMITGIGTSSVALAVRKIAQEKGKIDINTGAASADLTGPACSETGAHWVYDTYALAKVTGGAIVKGGQRLAGLLVFSTDVNSLTLPVAQGLVLTEAFYWDQNDETRAWTKRFRAKRDKIPSMLTAGAYSSVNHYLKAVQAAGTDDAKAVMAKMREMPVNDVMTKNGKLREDGRLVRDMHLFQVKAPSESKSKDDIYKLIATVPGDQAYRPLKEGKCPFVKD